jgi:hypothetical protein
MPRALRAAGIGGLALLSACVPPCAGRREFAFRERYSTVWVRREDAWRLVLEHGSVVEGVGARAGP